jgi:TusA-related sulfurtransferase
VSAIILKRGEGLRAISRSRGDHIRVMKMDYDIKLDAMGMMCPMPIVELSKKFKELEPGTVLMLEADDEGVIEDIPSWCNRTGNEFLGREEDGDTIRSYIKKL